MCDGDWWLTIQTYCARRVLAGFRRYTTAGMINAGNVNTEHGLLVFLDKSSKRGSFETKYERSI